MYMAGAFVPKRSPRDLPQGSAMTAIWRGARPGGLLPAGAALPGNRIHPVHLHASGMRLMMAILTHPRFPVPIWKVLQVRNHIRQIRAVDCAASLHLSARVEAFRRLPKGMEADLELTVRDDRGEVLRSRSTFYTRGTFAGAPETASPTPPEQPTEPAASWRIDRAGVGPFARLTGDYNGIHWCRPYARALGFRSPFAHPHRALAEVVDHLPGVDPAQPLEIDAWYRGPVYYGLRLSLLTADRRATRVFALLVEGDDRPALLGEVRSRPAPGLASG